MRCINFSVIFFKPNDLNIIILISFDYLEQDKRIKLNEIKLFKNKNDAINYLEEEKLDIVEKIDFLKQDKINDLVKIFIKYFSGKPINLIEKIDELNIDLALNEKFATPFSHNVIKNVMKLKRGEITTYSEIADKIGSRAYRAIGNVLKNNPLPLIIPCHKVIKKNGGIGGFMGEINQGWQLNLKKNLLEIEGFTNL